jgi:benzoylformate decarboxylase
VLVLRNEEYAILKWFSMLENVENAPGLDLPKLDVSAVAQGYGLRARRMESLEGLTSALRDAIASKQPEVIEVQVAPGMTLG